LIFAGNPDDVARRAQGRVWSLSIPQSSLASIADRYQVVSSRQADQRLIVRVLAEKKPAEDAEVVEPDLEDGYLAMLTDCRQGGAG
jgi:ABC-2 type transport system ATP-binding protein